MQLDGLVVPVGAHSLGRPLKRAILVQHIGRVGVPTHGSQQLTALQLRIAARPRRIRYRPLRRWKQTHGQGHKPELESTLSPLTCIGWRRMCSMQAFRMVVMQLSSMIVEPNPAATRLLRVLTAQS